MRLIGGLLIAGVIAGIVYLFVTDVKAPTELVTKEIPSSRFFE